MGKIKSFIRNIYSERKSEHFLYKSEPWSVLIFGRVFSIPLARAITKLPAKIHPNVITILTVPFALLAGICFFKGMLVYGAIFFLISFILDCTDGTLARLTSTTSKFGQKLDNYTDRLNNLFMYFGLWYSQYYLTGEWFLGGCIIGTHYLIMLFGTLFIKNHKYKTIFPRVSSYYNGLDEGILTFFVSPVLGIFRIMLPVLVGLQAISYTMLFLKQKFGKQNRKFK